MTRKASISQHSFKSAETVSESDSDSAASSTSLASSAAKRKLASRSADTPSKKVKFGAKNETRSLTASESESEESSEESDDSGVDLEAGVGGKVNKEGKEGDSSESSEESNDSDDDSDDVSASLQKPSSNVQEKSPTSTTAHNLPYAPPPGFTRVKATSLASEQASLFAPTSLNGKQIWHITAPASIPLAALHSITAEQLESGTSVLSHNGAQYKLVPRSAQRTSVLIPEKDGRYAQAQDGIVTQDFSLQHMVTIPEAALFPQDREVEDAPVVDVHAVQLAKEQPKGLRTRWWPTGFEDLSATEPATVGAAANKQKNHTFAGTDETPRKKSKKDKDAKLEKKRRRKSKDVDVAMGD
ncbi:hypothetical protein FH972_026188 [Carpinus fangiana]|uniref:Uncharacterized protein n=1 Tax=Carpinus fangiana TaxID=176857 RepID=A0A5N6L3L2_9ROSI|nr:hypothetical protein FH972_026188 [Carpinus fangiana]